MECSDTGSHEAVHLPELECDLAQDINDALGGIRKHGNGSGEILLRVVNGVVSLIRFAADIHRKPRKKTSKTSSAD